MNECAFKNDFGATFNLISSRGKGGDHCPYVNTTTITQIKS